MSDLVKHVILLVLALVLKERRFIRISRRNKKPAAIRIRDKKLGRTFSLWSRGRTDSITIDQIYTYEQYKLSNMVRYRDITAEYSRIVSAGRKPVILDCGGNIGLASRYFAAEFPGALVLCVEPDESNIREARKNTADFANVRCLPSAVGATPGFARILNPDANPNAFRVERTAGDSGIRIESIESLFDIAQEELGGVGELFVVKVDIEGFERELFAENTGWIAGLPLLMVELHDRLFPGTANSRNFLKAISAYDRDFIHREETAFSFRNFPR